MCSVKECVLSEGNICVCMGLLESFKAVCSKSCKLLVTELRLKIQTQQSILKQNPWCKCFFLFILPWCKFFLLFILPVAQNMVWESTVICIIVKYQHQCHSAVPIPLSCWTSTIITVQYQYHYHCATPVPLSLCSTSTIVTAQYSYHCHCTVSIPLSLHSILTIVNA